MKRATLYMCTLIVMTLPLLQCSLKSVSKRKVAQKIGPLNTLYEERRIEFNASNFEIKKERGIATSRLIKTPFPSNFIGLSWPHTRDFQYDYNFLLKTSQDGRHWSRWKDIFLTDDGSDRETDKNKGLSHKRYYSSLIYAKKAKFAQLKIVRLNFKKTHLESFTLRFINSRGNPKPIVRTKKSRDIITRQAWGAAEKGLWENRTPTPQHDIKHLVLHHTALDNHLPHEECDDAVRAYQVADLTKGPESWSDMGANYIICQHGTVYQGRRWHNGRDVIGRQMANHNRESIGIFIIGMFMDTQHINILEKRQLLNDMIHAGELRDSKDFRDLSQAPSDFLQKKILDFLYFKTKYYNLNPLGQMNYLPTHSAKPKQLATLLGHQDEQGTLCPGNNLYRLLPTFRETLSERMASF